jgi:hypothetical protein
VQRDPTVYTMIQADGTLYSLVPYIAWRKKSDKTLTLDGTFTVEELTAIVVHMQTHMEEAEAKTTVPQPKQSRTLKDALETYGACLYHALGCLCDDCAIYAQVYGDALRRDKQRRLLTQEESHF